MKIEDGSLDLEIQTPDLALKCAENGVGAERRGIWDREG